MKTPISARTNFDFERVGYAELRQFDLETRAAARAGCWLELPAAPGQVIDDARRRCRAPARCAAASNRTAGRTGRTRAAARRPGSRQPSLSSEWPPKNRTAVQESTITAAKRMPSSSSPERQQASCSAVCRAGRCRRLSARGRARSRRRRRRSSATARRGPDGVDAHAIQVSTWPSSRHHW